MTITLTDENFEKEISNAQKPVLVDFWIFGCVPCFSLSPILEKLAQEADLLERDQRTKLENG